MDRVVLGLSGGVDSAVAAALLRKAGYEVLALYLDMGAPGGVNEARSAARDIDIPLEVWDIGGALEEKVRAPFAAAYLRGETPNPCIMCNPSVKFRALCDFADKAGAKYIATGHYALAENGRLYKGRPANDQSYMLCRMTGEQLSRLILPLGAYEKKEVRQMAADMGFKVAKKPDSMEICFIPDSDYAAFIESRGTYPPQGNFVDGDGNVLGKHRGIHHYTLGQRRGLGIALGRRMFVSDIRPETNEVVLTPGDGLFVQEIFARDVNWLTDVPKGEFRCTARVRHSKSETAATAVPAGGGVRICFDEPVRAPTPGQSAVMYDGDLVLGGGTISRPGERYRT